MEKEGDKRMVDTQAIVSVEKLVELLSFPCDQLLVRLDFLP